MKNEEARAYTLIRDGKGIRVGSDKEDKVVILDFVDSATMFLNPKVAVGVGAELIEESMPFFETHQEFAQTLINTCADKRGQPPISMETLEGCLKKSFEEKTQFGIGSKDGKVLLNVDESEVWLGMSPEDAKRFAEAIILKAEQIENSKTETEQLH